MKRSTLYAKAISAFNAELRRVNREIEALNQRASRTVGRAKKDLDARRLFLWERKTWLDAEIKKTLRMKQRAKAGEQAVDAYAMPEGYMRPSEAITN